MSFSVNKNWFISITAIIIAIGIILGTGSLYRFAYNYNLIMTFTLFVMVIVIFYQYFVPISILQEDINSFTFQDISIPGIILISLMICIPLLSDIINQIPAYEVIFFYIAMLLLSFLLNKEFRKKIFDAYLVIIVTLSILSIIIILLEIFTEYLIFFPQIKVTTHFITDFYFISSINTNSVWIRNQSIFWEPGAFGFHLIFATLLSYKNKNTLFTSILILTSITTFSTTVFIFLILLGIYHIVFGKNKLKMFFIITSIITVAFVIIVSVLGNMLIPQLIIQALFDKFSPESKNYVSFVGRTLFTVEAFKMFLDNFFIGAGHYATALKLEVVRSDATVTTSGLAGLLAEFGLLGVFCIFLYTRYFWRFNLLAIPITLIWLNGEFLQYSPLALFILADSADDFSKIIFPKFVNN